MRKSMFVGLGLVAMVAAIAVAVSQLGGDSSGAPSGGGTAAPLGLAGPVSEKESVQASRDSAAQLPAQSSVEGYAAGGGQPALPLPQTLDRKIIRTATLEVTMEDVVGAVQRIENAALAAGGFVSASSLTAEQLPRPEGSDPSEPPPKRQRATVTVRVPAEAYGTVMDQIRGLGEVQSESSDASEVTEEFADLEARLRNLQRIEAQMLELLAKAETIPDILTVQDRINSVRLEIEQVQGRINLLDSLTELATITVQLAPPPPAAEEPVSEAGWAREAWENAWEASQETLQALGTVGIVAGVVLAWLAVPLLAIAIAWRLLGPRPGVKGS